ncbi:MAG: DUF2853 family protein [Robiginitomaculum sp.]
MENIISYITCFGWVPLMLFGVLGLGLGFLLFRGKKQAGDLSLEDEGQLRAESDRLRERINELESHVGSRDSEIGDLKAKLAASAATLAAGAAVAKVADKDDDDDTYALEWRNRYLAARVKYLEGRITEAPKEKPKAKKKTAPKKKVVKKVVKKAAPKVNMSIIARGRDQEAVDAYWANARKYDKTVSRKRIEELVKYCGISLSSRDGSLVACSQAHERNTIVKGYCAKKLSMNNETAKVAVESVCEKMKGERNKSRVTFYHLLDKAAGKKIVAKKIVTKKKKVTPKSPNAKYYDMVHKYDARASKSVIDNIVKYCGISLRTRDGSLVACSDEKERQTIVNGFATKKLGMKNGRTELVETICKDMKATRMKNRVTFYYLMSKKQGKLGLFK